ncbi:MAG: PAS domain S-box protein [Labilithrix sp.]|nr:PAS domain S-box protein [Labilithrix sp.]MCW5836342.1 PAS domain S-box protein [Labilithrix sp.]
MSSTKDQDPCKRRSRARGGLMLDVDERLRRCEDNLVNLLDATSDGILIHRDLRYVYANRAALEIVGKPREDVIGHSPFELVPPRFRMLLAERIMEAYTTRARMPEVEERLLHASGAEVPVEVVTVPTIFGGEVSTLVHIRDITARRELEVRLRAADRLASAGLVAAGVAHEIKNPLAYALTNLELLEQRFASECPSASDELRQLVAGVHDGIVRAAHVARDVKVFTGGQRGRATALDVRDVLRSTLAFLGPELRSRANVIERYGDVPKVLGNESRLAQVFLNLLTNAVQALTDARRPNDVTVTTRVKDGALVLVEVRDTGVGIPPELQSAIFEPLFTTKPDGTGLGLALCKELIAKEGGELTVESAVGAGTKFTVALRAAPREALEAARVPRARSSGKRILVVDDEPRLAATLKMVLADHHTTIARSGHEALQHLHAGEPYDLVISDLLMENIDGMDLYRRIGLEWPSLEPRIIFLTGDAFISRTQEFLAKIPNRHLQKPFDPDELLDVVDEVLEAGA